MEIEKNGKTYSVKENEKSWTLFWIEGRVSLNYNVKKEDCKTFEELKKFVETNSAF